MTTKKQRRAQVAERNAKAREALAAENLEKLYRSHDRDEQKRFDRERTEKKNKAKAIVDAKKAQTKVGEIIPENLRESYEAAQAKGIDLSRRTPEEQLLHDLFSAQEEAS